MATDDLSLSERMAVFRAVVEAEDLGKSPREARREVAERFQVTVDQVEAIEEEGIDKSWPPLETCDDE